MLRSSRRTFLTSAAAVPLLGPFRAASRTKPNFVIIMADDLSARELGCYSSVEHETPNLDFLASYGCKFETCWATPICSPTRAEIMTGRYGFRTGWYHNVMKPAPGDPLYNLATANRTFVQVLRRADYRTAISGKWQMTGTLEEHRFDEHCLWQWYPEYDGPIETAEDGRSPGRAARYWHPAIVMNGAPVAVTDQDYGPDIFADFTIDFIDRNRDKPFIVYHSMCLPHIAWNFDREMETHLDVPEVDATGEKKQNRRPGSLKSNIEYIDVLVGRIVEALEQLDLTQRTIVFFTADNGSESYGKNKTERERGPRVPMIVYGPTYVGARGSVGALIDLSDILPTVAELAGAALSRDYLT